MKCHRMFGDMTINLLVCVSLVAGLLLAGCVPPPASPTPAATGAGASEEVDLEAKGFVESADGGLRISGRARLLLSLRRIANPPAAPAGWEFVGPVFDIIARDRERRPVQQLAEALQLRFNIKIDRPVTVIVYRENQWQIVESDLDDEGKLIASVNHLTPYGVAAPARGRGTPFAPKITPSPKATVSVATVTPSEAQTVLGEAIQVLKGKSVKVVSAVGYTGALYVAIPPALQGSLGEAIGAGGAGFYGLYNAVNEAITVQAAGGPAVGSLTLLVEPKTSLPASASDAQVQLKTLFPGITAPLTQVQAATSTYTFYGISGNTAYLAGYISYEGLILAYVMAGSGSYQALVPKQ